MLVAANKADHITHVDNAVEFYALGLGEVFAISAIHGLGVGDMLDAVYVALEGEKFPEFDEDDDHLKIAIVGRPNVGKSSLLNRLLGEERVIVSPIAGTTRDAIDTDISYFDERVTLIDTAGIRRRGKIEPGVEKYSVVRANKAMERADVVLLVIDAVDGITEQDQHIGGLRDGGEQERRDRRQQVGCGRERDADVRTISRQQVAVKVRFPARSARDFHQRADRAAHSSSAGSGAARLRRAAFPHSDGGTQPADARRLSEAYAADSRDAPPEADVRLAGRDRAAA